MIFLDYLYNLPNSTSGIDQITKDTITAMPNLAPLLLLFVFFVVLLGGSMRQKLKTGTADFPLWMVVASLMTFMVTLILSTTSGIIRLDWLVIVVVITMLSGVWLFLDRRGQEF